MLKIKLITILFAMKNLFIPGFVEKKQSGFRFERNGYKIERVGTFPDSILESSGIEIAQEGKTYWTQGDGGSKNQLFEVDISGKVVSVFPLPGIRNIDWEELAEDDEGNLYVCDIGNNANRRKNLKIYKINVKKNNRIDTIHYNYPDQTAFPPGKAEMNFDCEGVFWHEENLYLISKNRGGKNVRIYKLPDQGGCYVAEIADCIYINSPITAADISPDKKLVAMLTYGKIYFLKCEKGDTLKVKPYFVRKFNRSVQAEALVFINNTDLLITNEQRQIFLIRKKKKKE